MRFVLSALFVCVLVVSSGCSNGRGSVAEQAGGEAPPPSSPVPPPSAPPETPPPPEEPAPTPPPEPQPQPQPQPEPEPEPPTPAPGEAALAGYWLGKISDRDSDRERDAIALIDRAGEMHFLVIRPEGEPEFALHGELCCGASAEEEIAAYRYLSTRDDEAGLELAASNRRLRGEFEYRDRKYEFALDANAAYARALTQQQLAGVYTGRTPDAGPGSSGTVTLTIDPSGALNGSHSNGCILQGAASIPDPARNMVRLNVEMTSCGGMGSSRRWNGSYRGLGVQLRNVPSPSDGTTRTDVFYFSLVGPTWLGAFELER